MITQTSPIQPAAVLLPSGSWRVDPSRSRVVFAVRKLGAGTVRGRFADVDGKLVVTGNHVSASGAVRVAGIATGNEDRDAHLRSPGFFASDAHPDITFVSRGAVGTEQCSVCVLGELTIRGRTQYVELTARPVAESDGATRIQARGEIDRRDFGLTWNRAIEASGVVSTKVRIELDLLLIPETSPPPAQRAARPAG
jgi:polyisoprenoid-binding protein YceI